MQRVSLSHMSMAVSTYLRLLRYAPLPKHGSTEPLRNASVARKRYSLYCTEKILVALIWKISCIGFSEKSFPMNGFAHVYTPRMHATWHPCTVRHLSPPRVNLHHLGKLPTSPAMNEHAALVDHRLTLTTSPALYFFLPLVFTGCTLAMPSIPISSLDSN